jgi:hypothetical protein
MNNFIKNDEKQQKHVSLQQKQQKITQKTVLESKLTVLMSVGAFLLDFSHLRVVLD